MMYTNEELIQYLIDYYNKFGKSPTRRDIKKPSFKTFINRFGSWNATLEFAGLPIRKSSKCMNKPNVCEICKTTESTKGCNKEGLKVCGKCANNNRNYLHGLLDPKSRTGVGVIAEHVVFEVLNDCIKCNTQDNFHSCYDLISEKYGTINVKSSRLYKHNGGVYRKHQSLKEPDYYICIGFKFDKTKILKVWIIPSDSKIVAKCNITISNNNLNRAFEYEVNSERYNNIYKNLNILKLPEFRNINYIKL